MIINTKILTTYLIYYKGYENLNGYNTEELMELVGDINKFKQYIKGVDKE